MSFIDSENFHVYNTDKDHRIIGDLIECDDFIAPIISILNKKGYKTVWSCSGHMNETLYKFDGKLITMRNRCYIQFHQTVTIDDLVIIPDGFSVDYVNENEFQILIEKEFEIVGHECYLEILDTMRLLLDWVNKLPENKK